MHNWKTKSLTTTTQVFDALQQLMGKRWLVRGQSRPFNALHPSLDRNGLKSLSRQRKLALERQSINLFRSCVRFWAPGEESHPADDVKALMVMRHYSVPTRLLDWSSSPYVALYFATETNLGEDCELWAFDEPRYETEGRKQWTRWPETSVGGSFDARLTMFLPIDPPPWFVCQFYEGFPRQMAQHGAFSLTPDFGRDHAKAISAVFESSGQRPYLRFLVKAKLKAQLQSILRQKHGIWRGSLFPDSAGAAETAKSVFRADS